MNPIQNDCLMKDVDIMKRLLKQEFKMRILLNIQVKFLQKKKNSMEKSIRITEITQTKNKIFNCKKCKM